jgi:hypothetical protein
MRKVLAARYPVPAPLAERPSRPVMLLGMDLEEKHMVEQLQPFDPRISAFTLSVKDMASLQTVYFDAFKPNVPTTV